MAPSISGSELTIEPFRWDQRFFSIILQFSNSGSQLSPTLQKATELYGPMCDVTGGILQTAFNMKTLLQSMENIASRFQNGVVLNFELLSNNNNLPIGSHKRLVYVKQSSGFWPLPEAFWPDPNMTSLVKKKRFFS